LINAEEAKKLYKERLQKDKEARLALVEEKCACTLQQIEQWIISACNEGKNQIRVNSEIIPYGYMVDQIGEYLHDKLGYDSEIEWDLDVPTILIVKWAD